MKILRYFSLTFVFSALLIASCTNSESTNPTIEPPTEEQIDTISLADEKPADTTEIKEDVNPVKNTSTKQVNVKKVTAEKQAKESSENQVEVKKETVKKTETLKTDTYNFIIANTGKQVADDFKGDLMTSAAEEVYIEKKGKCGNEDCGKKIILVNMNQNKMIETTVQINWKENDKKFSKKRSYKLRESQKLEIGCSSKCNENKTTIKWQIIGAVYSD